MLVGLYDSQKDTFSNIPAAMKQEVPTHLPDRTGYQRAEKYLARVVPKEHIGAGNTIVLSHNKYKYSETGVAGGSAELASEWAGKGGVINCTEEPFQVAKGMIALFVVPTNRNQTMSKKFKLSQPIFVYFPNGNCIQCFSSALCYCVSVL